MGCDIHFYVETQDENGAWKSADKWETEDGYTSVVYDERFYRGRNYDLFAILADVRNGYGFAGCDTGDGFEPIAQPKGLPDDVSPEVKANAVQWDGDGHSHSHFTLAELQAYDFEGKTTKHRGYVSIDAYLAWKKSGEVSPRMYFGGTSMPKVDEKAIEGFNKAEIVKRYGEDVCILCEWSESYAESASDFIANTLPKMAELNSDPNKVRAVFWFDN